MTADTEPTRLVVLSLERWDEVWRRNQYLLDGLLRRDPTLEVLFVEPPADPMHALARGARPHRGLGLRTAHGYDGRLHLYEPTKLLPRLFGPAADGLLRAELRSAVRRLRWRSGMLWINDPAAARLVGRPGWPALYDITDDWVEAARGAREHDRIERSDTYLLAFCEEVVVCSPVLLRAKSALRPAGASAPRLIPNAVDRARYRMPHARPDDLPVAPVALYVGTLHEDRLDVDLVVATADAVGAAGGVVVLVGPNALSEPNARRLHEHPAVLVLGARDRDAVPGYLQHADVLIVPHRVDDFTESLDPIKLYEYLAVGRPVVSTPVAGFRDDQRVELADPRTFATVVAARAATHVPTVEHDGVPDWSDRVADVEDVLAALRR